MEMPFEHYAAGERLYNQIVAPVCEKHGLTHMEFTILLFLANNLQYDTAAEIVKYRRLVKSHVSISIRSLQEKGLLSAQHWEPDRRALHLKVLPAARAAVEIIARLRACNPRDKETALQLLDVFLRSLH